MSASKLIVATVLVSGLAGVAPASAAPTRVQAGSLTCDVSAGIGVIIGSKRDVDCFFTPTSPGIIEHYRGTITKLGVDIGVINRGSLIWLVYAPANRTEGALQGSYGGAAANATVGVGLGANVLAGGFDHSVALQPLSVEGTTGLNIAAGIASLNLRYEPAVLTPVKPPAHHVKHPAKAK